MELPKTILHPEHGELTLKIDHIDVRYVTDMDISIYEIDIKGDLGAAKEKMLKELAKDGFV